jgi:hypothetical protein
MVLNRELVLSQLFFMSKTTFLTVSVLLVFLASSILAIPSFAVSPSPTINNNKLDFTISSVIYSNTTWSFSITNTGKSWISLGSASLGSVRYPDGIESLYMGENLTTGQTATVTSTGPNSKITFGDIYYGIYISLSFPVSAQVPLIAVNYGSAVIGDDLLANGVVQTFTQTYNLGFHGPITANSYSVNIKNGGTEKTVYLDVSANGNFTSNSKPIQNATATVKFGSVAPNAIVTKTISSTKALHFVADTQYKVCISASFSIPNLKSTEVAFNSIQFCGLMEST